MKRHTLLIPIVLCALLTGLSASASAPAGVISSPEATAIDNVHDTVATPQGLEFQIHPADMILERLELPGVTVPTAYASEALSESTHLRAVLDARECYGRTFFPWTQITPPRFAYGSRRTGDGSSSPPIEALASEQSAFISSGNPAQLLIEF